MDRVYIELALFSAVDIYYPMVTEGFMTPGRFYAELLEDIGKPELTDWALKAYLTKEICIGLQKDNGL